MKMPIKSDPFWTVMGAPAPLSTNIDVYWPLWKRKKIRGQHYIHILKQLIIQIVNTFTDHKHGVPLFNQS